MSVDRGHGLIPIGNVGFRHRIMQINEKHFFPRILKTSGGFVAVDSETKVEAGNQFDRPNQLFRILERTMIATCMEPMNFNAKRWQDRQRTLTAQCAKLSNSSPRSHSERHRSVGCAGHSPDRRADHAGSLAPAPSGNWLDLTAMIDFARLKVDLQFRVNGAQHLWIDRGGTRRQAECVQARQFGWTIKRPREPSGHAAVDYIRNCIRRATERARSGEPVTLCLIAHVNRYARQARQFCKSGGRLLLVLSVTLAICSVGCTKYRTASRNCLTSSKTAGRVVSESGRRPSGLRCGWHHRQLTTA